jgi:hypothetical protein
MLSTVLLVHLSGIAQTKSDSFKTALLLVDIQS